MTTNQSSKKDLILKNQKQVPLLLEKMKSQLTLVLPGHMSAERMTRIALTEFRKTPKLAECDPMSICASVLMSAQLGLEVGVLGQGYLVPYWNKKLNCYECQFIPGYRGFITLARRSGQIISISTQIVYENDEFYYELGLDDKLIHKPVKNNPGNMIAAYSVAKLVGGGHQFLVMFKERIDQVRDKAQAQSGPWASDYEAMAMKTVVRRLFKWLPCSVEMQKAAIIDEHSEAGILDIKAVVAEDDDTVAKFFEGETEVVDIETGEVKSQADNLADKI
jgi:recombination protein RecT